MKKITLILFLLLVSTSAHASDETAQLAVSGYDVVSYFTDSKAVRGSGFNLSTHEGETYLFSSKENKAKFDASPAKFLPQYGGWCAYGASLGKKFYTNPEVFEVINGKLYLNLDSSIQEKWSKDKSGFIKSADSKWKEIENTKASSL